MSTLSIRMPSSVHKTIREIAEEDQISINQFVVSACIEKISAMETAQYLETRAKRGNRERFVALLKKVPDVTPEQMDRIPN